MMNPDSIKLKNSKTIFVFLLMMILFKSTLCNSIEVDVQIYGIHPDTKENMVPAVRRLLNFCKNKKTILVFPKGRYDFYPDKLEKVTIAFHILGIKDMTIDGRGSEFIFHGLMMPVRIEQSENIVLKNFSVDWQRPFISQGQIIGVNEKYLDLTIDKTQYPYEIETGHVWFTSNDWGRRRNVDSYCNLYDKTTKEIVYRTRDNPLGIDFNGHAEELSPGIIRFYGKLLITPQLGTYVTLNHGRYIVKGIDIVESKDIALKDITLYHVLSGGVVGARTENITLDSVNILANLIKNRVFSGIADGFHFIHCKGKIIVNGCSMTGQGDDFLNIHGRNCVVIKRKDDRTIRVIRAECTGVGDKVWLIRKNDVQRREVYTVASIKRVPITNKLGEYETKINNGIDPAWGISTNKQGEWEVTFTKSLPQDFNEGDFFENKTWNASLKMTNCHILKSHRARGILVTTPKKVIIEKNYFRTSGTAILIEGDTDHWYESGANTNVLIRDNVFEDCLTSGSDTGGRWEWGEAIITVTPSHQPKSVDDKPYHRNIRIKQNTFKTFDLPLLRARSVRNLVFTRNTVERTFSFPSFAWQKAAFWFDGCRKVALCCNKYNSEYKGKDIWIENMRQSDLLFKNKRIFNVVEISQNTSEKK